MDANTTRLDYELDQLGYFYVNNEEYEITDHRIVHVPNFANENAIGDTEDIPSIASTGVLEKITNTHKKVGPLCETVELDKQAFLPEKTKDNNSLINNLNHDMETASERESCLNCDRPRSYIALQTAALSLFIAGVLYMHPKIRQHHES